MQCMHEMVYRNVPIGWAMSLVYVARPADVLHQVRPVRLQGSLNAPQDVERLRLVVYGVERGDEVE